MVQIRRCWQGRECQFNDWANAEAIKFEKVRVVFPRCNIIFPQRMIDGVSNDDGWIDAIASDAIVAEGNFVNAVEVFWTPSDREEVLTNMDIIADFPTLVTL